MSKKCPICGKQLENEDKFCMGCGNKFEDAVLSDSYTFQQNIATDNNGSAITYDDSSNTNQYDNSFSGNVNSQYNNAYSNNGNYTNANGNQYANNYGYGNNNAYGGNTYNNGSYNGQNSYNNNQNGYYNQYNSSTFNSMPSTNSPYSSNIKKRNGLHITNIVLNVLNLLFLGFLFIMYCAVVASVSEFEDILTDDALMIIGAMIIAIVANVIYFFINCIVAGCSKGKVGFGVTLVGSILQIINLVFNIVMVQMLCEALKDVIIFTSKYNEIESVAMVYEFVAIAGIVYTVIMLIISIAGLIKKQKYVNR